MTSVPLSDDRYDPMLSTRLDLDCSKYKTLEIKCKYSLTGASSGYLGFYFATASQTGLSESKSVKCRIEQDSNGYQVLRFEMYKNEAWSGTLTQLRFDPFDCAGTIDIAYIRFVEADIPDVLLEDDAEGDNAKFLPSDVLTLATDPDARMNQCYHAATAEGNRWLYSVCSATFTPGVTYQVDFDIRLDRRSSRKQSGIL